jgi:DNA-directed RNA polymerase subunit M/transcription elongation factor TFIIS
MIYKCPHCGSEESNPVRTETMNEDVFGDVFECVSCEKEWTILWVKGESYLVTGAPIDV